MRSQRIAESAPLTARLGPTSSPTSSAGACAGACAEKSTAAGRLFTISEVVEEAGADPKIGGRGDPQSQRKRNFGMPCRQQTLH